MPAPDSFLKKSDLDPVIQQLNGVLAKCYPIQEPPPTPVVPTDPPCPTPPPPTEGQDLDSDSNTATADPSTPMPCGCAVFGYVSTAGNCGSNSTESVVKVKVPNDALGRACSNAGATLTCYQCTPKPSPTPVPTTTPCYIAPVQAAQRLPTICTAAVKNSERRRLKNPLNHGGVMWDAVSDPAADVVAAYNPLAAAQLINDLRAQVEAIVPNFCDPRATDHRWRNYTEILAELQLGQLMPDGTRQWTEIEPGKQPPALLEILGLPEHGTLLGIDGKRVATLSPGVDVSGRIHYVPDTDFEGTDSFTYRTCAPVGSYPRGPQWMHSFKVSSRLPLAAYPVIAEAAIGATLEVWLPTNRRGAAIAVVGAPETLEVSVVRQGDWAKLVARQKAAKPVAETALFAYTSTVGTTTAAGRVQLAFKDNPAGVPIVAGPAIVTCFPGLARKFVLSAADPKARFVLLDPPTSVRLTPSTLETNAPELTATWAVRETAPPVQTKATFACLSPQGTAVVTVVFKRYSRSYPVEWDRLGDLYGFPTGNTVDGVPWVWATPSSTNCAAAEKVCEKRCGTAIAPCKAACVVNRDYAIRFENLRHDQALMNCGSPLTGDSLAAENALHTCNLWQAQRLAELCDTDCAGCKHLDCLKGCADSYNACAHMDQADLLVSCASTANDTGTTAFAACLSARTAATAAATTDAQYTAALDAYFKCTETAGNTWVLALNRCYSTFITLSRERGDGRKLECDRAYALCRAQYVRANNCQTTVPNCYDLWFKARAACVGASQTCLDNADRALVTCVDGLPQSDQSCLPGCGESYKAMLAACTTPKCAAQCRSIAHTYYELCQEMCGANFSRGMASCRDAYTTCNEMRNAARLDAEQLAVDRPKPFQSLPKYHARGFATTLPANNDADSKATLTPYKLPGGPSAVPENLRLLYTEHNLLLAEGLSRSFPTADPATTAPVLPFAGTVTAEITFPVQLSLSSEYQGTGASRLPSGGLVPRYTAHLTELSAVLSMLECCTGCEYRPDPAIPVPNPACPPLQTYDSVAKRCKCPPNQVPAAPPASPGPPGPAPQPTDSPVTTKPPAKGCQTQGFWASTCRGTSNDPAGWNEETNQCCCTNGAVYDTSVAKGEARCLPKPTPTQKLVSCCGDANTVVCDSDMQHNKWCRSPYDSSGGKITLCSPDCGAGEAGDRTPPAVVKVEAQDPVSGLWKAFGSGRQCGTNEQLWKWQGYFLPTNCWPQMVSFRNTQLRVTVECPDDTPAQRVLLLGAVGGNAGNSVPEALCTVTQLTMDGVVVRADQGQLCCGCCAPIANRFPTLLLEIDGISERQWWRTPTHSSVQYGSEFEFYDVTSGVGLLGSAFTTKLDDPGALCPKNNKTLIMLLKQLHAEIAAEYLSGVWIKTEEVEGSSAVPYWQRSDYSIPDYPTATGYGWFNSINLLSFDFSEGVITTTLGGFASVPVNSALFCSLVDQTILQFQAAIQKLRGVRVSGGQIETEALGVGWDSYENSCSAMKSEIEAFWGQYGVFQELPSGIIQTYDFSWDVGDGLHYGYVSRVRGKITVDLSLYSGVAEIYCMRSLLAGWLVAAHEGDIPSMGAVDSKFHSFTSTSAGSVYVSSLLNGSTAFPGWTKHCPSSSPYGGGFQVADVIAIVKGSFAF